MKDYRYVLARKYPFIKKRELTETEIVEQRVMDYFYLLPVVYTILFLARVIGFVYSLLGLDTKLRR